MGQCEKQLHNPVIHKNRKYLAYPGIDPSLRPSLKFKAGLLINKISFHPLIEFYR